MHTHNTSHWPSQPHHQQPHTAWIKYTHVGPAPPLQTFYIQIVHSHPPILYTSLSYLVWSIHSCSLVQKQVDHVIMTVLACHIKWCCPFLHQREQTIASGCTNQLQNELERDTTYSNYSNSGCELLCCDHSSWLLVMVYNITQCDHACVHTCTTCADVLHLS